MRTLRKTSHSQFIFSAVALACAVQFFFPQTAVLADVLPDRPESMAKVQVATVDFAVGFPENDLRPARRVMHLPVTAYSSTPDQTDDTPFTTAMGTEVRPGVIAANFLPFGSHVRLPDHFGERVFVVEDRMNARYDYRIDIWMSSREEAKQWGRRSVRVEVL